jgi:glycosyltransferase involved in cell wall biosynthesis
MIQTWKGKTVVSVVIPAYNQAQYLAEAIDSVLGQAVSGMEIIVVDDGSTDETAAIAQQYGADVRYIYQENQGLAAARNTGIRAARGHYVALLDSDDLWKPNFISKMLALARKEPGMAVFYCGFDFIDDNGQQLPQTGSSHVVPPGQIYHVLLRSNFLAPSTILMRREAALEVGLFDPNFRRLQDWEMWLRLLRRGYHFQGIPNQLVYYRIHNRSLSTDPYSGQQAAMALAVKHFGEDDGQWQQWPADKRRMFGGVYRYHALTTSLIRGGDWAACARFLRRAFLIDPSLADDLDLFYELALGAQPIGQRGTKTGLDFARREADVRQLLTSIFSGEKTASKSLQRKTIVTAWYALALVAYNFQSYHYSRHFLCQLWHYNPLSFLIRRVIVLWLRNLARQIQFSRYLSRQTAATK